LVGLVASVYKNHIHKILGAPKSNPTCGSDTAIAGCGKGIAQRHSTTLRRTVQFTMQHRKPKFSGIQLQSCPKQQVVIIGKWRKAQLAVPEVRRNPIVPGTHPELVEWLQQAVFEISELK